MFKLNFSMALTSGASLFHSLYKSLQDISHLKSHSSGLFSKNYQCLLIISSIYSGHKIL